MWTIGQTYGHLRNHFISRLEGVDLKIDHISAIGMKFGTMMHTGPRKWTGSLNFQLLKIQDGGQPPS